MKTILKIMFLVVSFILVIYLFAVIPSNNSITGAVVYIHKECRADQCVTVTGRGGNDCDNDVDCGGTDNTPSSSTCVENWQCGGWGACVNQVQNRVCVELNDCGSAINKPNLIRGCTSEDITEIDLSDVSKRTYDLEIGEYSLLLGGINDYELRIIDVLIDNIHFSIYPGAIFYNIGINQTASFILDEHQMAITLNSIDSEEAKLTFDKLPPKKTVWLALLIIFIIIAAGGIAFLTLVKEGERPYKALFQPRRKRKEAVQHGKEVDDYIRKALQEKLKISEIKQNLISVGWPRDLVYKAISRALKKKK